MKEDRERDREGEFLLALFPFFYFGTLLLSRVEWRFYISFWFFSSSSSSSSSHSLTYIPLTLLIRSTQRGEKSARRGHRSGPTWQVQRLQLQRSSTPFYLAKYRPLAAAAKSILVVFLLDRRLTCCCCCCCSIASSLEAIQKKKKKKHHKTLLDIYYGPIKTITRFEDAFRVVQPSNNPSYRYHFFESLLSNSTIRYHLLICNYFWSCQRRRSETNLSYVGT